MAKKLQCILLIDDNPDDNFFHEWIIKKSNAAETVVAKQSGEEGLAYLESTRGDKDLHPDLVFLDLNMPGMNGWDFLEEYSKLDAKAKCKAMVVMLTTSSSPSDRAKAAAIEITLDYKTKPLSKGMLEEIIDKYF